MEAGKVHLSRGFPQDDNALKNPWAEVMEVLNIDPCKTLPEPWVKKKKRFDIKGNMKKDEQTIRKRKVEDKEYLTYQPEMRNSRQLLIVHEISL